MSVNIDALFQHLMEDPDIVPPEGEDKEDIAMAMARQRAKQSNNNTKALSMAKAYSNIEKLLTFLKAEGDEDSPLTPAQMNLYARHIDKINTLTARLQSGLELTPTMQRDWDAAEKFSEDIARPAKLPGIHDVIDEHNAAMVDVAGEGAGEQPGEEDDDTATPEEAPTPKEGFEVGQAGQTEAEKAARAKMSTGERRAAALKRAAELAEADTSDADAVKEAVRETISAGEIKEEGEDTQSPFHPTNFGDTAKQQQGYHQVIAAARKFAPDKMSEDDFLDTVLDWNNRGEGSKGDPDHRLYDGLPGNNKREYSHHDGGNPNANINPQHVLTMIRQYNSAKEDQAKEAAKVEGDPIVTSPPPEGETDEEKLALFSGKPVASTQSAQAKYQEDMDNLLDKFKNAFSEGKGRKKTVRSQNPTAAKALDEVRAAWDATGLEAQRDSGAIDDSEYYEGLHTFIEEHKPTHNQQYAPGQAGKKSRIGTIPTAPPPETVLPSNPIQEELTAKIKELKEARAAARAAGTPGAEGGVDAIVDEISDEISSGTGTAGKQASDVQALTDFAEEAVNQMNEGADDPITYNPPTSDEIKDKIVTEAVTAVGEGEKSSESLASAENLVGEETLGEIADAHGLPESKTPMSSAARKYLTSRGIDPDGEGLDHIKKIADAREHVKTHEAEVAQSESGETPEGATGLDDFGDKHLQDWLDNHVGEKGDPDYEPLRNQVEAGLKRQLEDEPGLLEEGKSWSEIRQRAESNNFMPEIEDSADAPGDDDIDWDNLSEEQKDNVADNGGIWTADGFVDAPANIQEQHEYTPTATDTPLDQEDIPTTTAEAPKPRKPMTAAARKHLEDNGIDPDDPDSSFQEQLAQIRTKKEAEAFVAQKPQAPVEGGETAEETPEETPTTELEPESEEGAAEQEVDPADAIEETDAEPVGDETPIDEDTRNFITSKEGITQQIDIRRAHTDTANEIQNKQLDAGFNFDEHGDLLDRHADFSKHTTSMQNGYMELVKHLNDNPEATSVPKDIWDKTFGEEGHLALNKDEDGNLSLGQHSRHADAAAELHEDTDKVIKTGTLESKKDFLLENKMTPERLKSLTDENIDKEFNKAHEKISDKAMSDHLAGKLNKEEILKIMAKDHGREGDTAYLDKLREDHQLKTTDELVKEHKEAEKNKATMKFEHARNDAISSALNMDELPEEGLDKLHAMDRARDIAKKLNTNQKAVDEGGKSLLDSNSMSHLKSLLSDAVDKGELSQEEIDGIGEDALEKGDEFLNDDHRASIEADNEIKRAHHEEFLDHAEGTSEEALQRKGDDLDHSKAHEIHEYSINEDGTVGKRTGSSHHYRDEDGSVQHRDASGEGGVPGSDDDAVRGKDGEPMEAQHPPKLLGLDNQQKIEQKEHFELMKKVVAATEPLSEGEINNYREFEANNPALATPKYKGQLLGAVRHQLSGEDGPEKMSAMGIDEKDHAETAEASCQAPVGEPHPGADKGWNPATHRWADKEYLEGKKGELSPGEAVHMPLGLHHGAVDKDGNSLEHLDKNKNGDVQGGYLTNTGFHPSDPSKGGEKGMKSAADGLVSSADVAGHHLSGVPHGEKIDKKTQGLIGINHSEKHTSEGQGGIDLGRSFRETPGMKGVEAMKPVLGKLGRMIKKNKEREEGKPNVTAIDRQRARRGTDGSPAKSLLSRLGAYTKEGLKDAAEELPGLLGGAAARRTDRYKDKQVRRAADKVQKRNTATQELTDRIHRVMGERE